MVKVLKIEAILKHYDCWSTLCEGYLCSGKINYATKVGNDEIMEFSSLKFSDIKLFSYFTNIAKKKNMIDILYFRKNSKNNMDIVYVLDYNHTVRKTLEFLHPFLEEVITKNGIEYWKIYSITSRKNIYSVLDTLRHSLERENIRVLDINFNLYKINEIMTHLVLPSLTDRESEILYKAYREGYFEVPRKITLTELADNLNISKVALLKTLKNSIKKLIKNYFGRRIVM